MPPKPNAFQEAFSRAHQMFSAKGGSSIPKMPAFQLSSVAGWYPRKIGNGLAHGMCGHSAFIKDVPKEFNAQYAKHFALVEAMSMMPAASLIIVHYFSSMLRYRDRQNTIAPLQQELNNKIRAVHFWLGHLESRDPTMAPFWRVGLLAMQVTTFPLWLFTAATAPPVFHCALEEANHILNGKYACLLNKGPPMIQQRVQQTDEANEFHKLHSLIKTDIAALMFVFMIMYFLLR